MIVIEKFVLDLGHVHVRRALGFASFAFEAKIHHLVEPLAGELILRHFARQHASERIGAPARGMLLVKRAHVRRTHGAVELLAALAHAAAHLDGAHEAALLAKIQRRLRLPGLVLRTDLERLRHRR